MAERAAEAPRRAICNGKGCRSTALQFGSSLCVNCTRRETLVASMATVLRYETEWALTGEVWKDEEYLTAKEFVARWAGAL
jgi:hypothetical protein